MPASEPATMKTVLAFELWTKRFNSIGVAMLGVFFSTGAVTGLGALIFLFKPQRWLARTLIVAAYLFLAELAVLVLSGALEWVVKRAAKKYETRLAQEIRRKGKCTSRAEYFWIFSGACENCGGRTWLHYRWFTSSRPIFAEVCAHCRKGVLNDESMRNVHGEWFPIPGRERSEDFTRYQMPSSAVLIDERRIKGKHLDGAECERIPEFAPD